MNKLVILILFLVILLLTSIAVNIYLLFFKKEKEKKCEIVKIEEQNNSNITIEEETDTDTDENVYKYKPIHNQIIEYVEFINKDIVEEYTYFDDKEYVNERNVFKNNYHSDKLTKEEILLQYNTSEDNILYFTFITKREINEGVRITILVDNTILHQNLKMNLKASILKYKLKKPITKIMIMVMNDDIPKFTEIFRVDYKGLLYKNFSVKSFNTLNPDYNSGFGVIESGNEYYIDLI